MVAVIMGRDQIVNGGNILFLQIRNHKTGSTLITTVINHGLSIGLYQDTQSLSHIQKMNFHLTDFFCRLRCRSFCRCRSCGFFRCGLRCGSVCRNFRRCNLRSIRYNSFRCVRGLISNGNCSGLRCTFRGKRCGSDKEQKRHKKRNPSGNRCFFTNQIPDKWKKRHSGKSNA